MRVERLLSIILLLLKRDVMTGKELADQFEVSLRTIYRDIDKLCEAGVPIVAEGGHGGGFSLMEQYRLSEMFFNSSEVQVLLPIMASLSSLVGRNEIPEKILHKLALQDQSPSSGENNIHINISQLNMEEKTKSYFRLINKALQNKLLIQFDYTNRRFIKERRCVEPIQIDFHHGYWSVIAFCHLRKDYRRFKLSRMQNVSLGEKFYSQPISAEALQAVFEQGYIRNSIKVKLKFSIHIGPHLQEYFPLTSIQPDEEGGFIVEEDYPYEEGLLRFILSFGKECEVMEPAFLRLEMKNYLEEMIKHYGSYEEKT
ncbi:YafY family protein [Mechercharimyces sp. CAU 1602]|uniref:helix-turn-helix transcriptional regulator n=1 Tax=Mechercharimyces sp. CAU 1602 TaxID=2973933 RepID=UPI0021627CA2|nr:YafY family protein [Mechercharimyces sp. CAU 1602]MCS1351939.1 YafY family transcriptional regulator [Mechercharimyces sp. CAU 1602]